MHNIVLVLGSGLGDPTPVQEAVWVAGVKVGMNTASMPVHVLATTECKESISVVVVHHSSVPDLCRELEEQIYDALRAVFPKRPINICILAATSFLTFAEMELRRGISG